MFRRNAPAMSLFSLDWKIEHPVLKLQFLVDSENYAINLVYLNACHIVSKFIIIYLRAYYLDGKLSVSLVT